MEKNLDITKPRYSEQVLPVPWPFVISRFHCIGQPSYSAPIHVTSMLTVITPWGPITVLVTLNILEMASRAQVNLCLFGFYSVCNVLFHVVCILQFVPAVLGQGCILGRGRVAVRHRILLDAVLVNRLCLSPSVCLSVCLLGCLSVCP